MKTNRLLYITLVIILPWIQIQAQSIADPNTSKNINILTITFTKLDANDTYLKLSYEIRNDSKQDAWILAGIGISGSTASVFMDTDGQTLKILRRLDLPAITGIPFPTCFGRYVRLPAGKSQAESISLMIPVYDNPDYGIGHQSHKESGLEYATRLVIEIGYYTGNLPVMIRNILEEDEKNPRIVPYRDPCYSKSITEWFGGLLGFNNRNELLRSRDDEILVPYTSQAFSGEQVLQIVAENLKIPYREKQDLSKRRYPPDLSPFTRIEIQYQPSALVYFFPYAGQQNLLNLEEKKYLQSMNTIILENQESLKLFADDVKRAKQYSGIVRQISKAQVVCYISEKKKMSFPIYNDCSVVTEEKRFICSDGFISLRKFTPQVWKIDLRIRCSENLKDLWHRFRLYQQASKSVRTGLFRRRENRPYPLPNTWCDSIIRSYRITKMSDEDIFRPFICPSAGEGKCHYAMNPNCKYDSPGDMVLLFETKAGWNQYGGPELFTFDNHDPRGGCVLLNDGTVKFIRTEDELKALRWK
jgi:hypothetical protein